MVRGQDSSRGRRESIWYHNATLFRDPLGGREQAAVDYEPVEEVVSEATADNAWSKAEHWQHSADCLGHLVAASYASPELSAKTPEGYGFLPRIPIILLSQFLQGVV